MSGKKVIEQQDIVFENLKEHYIKENIRIGVDKNNDIVVEWGYYTDYKIDLYRLHDSWMVLYVNQGAKLEISSFDNLENAVKKFSSLITKTNNIKKNKASK